MRGISRPIATAVALMMLWTQSGCGPSVDPVQTPDSSSSSLPIGVSLPSRQQIPWDSAILEREIVQEQLEQHGLTIPEGSYPLLSGGVILPQEDSTGKIQISAAVYHCASFTGDSAGPDRLLLLYGWFQTTDDESDSFSEQVALFPYREQEDGLGNYSTGKIQFSSDWRSGVLLRGENGGRCLAASPRTGELLPLEGLAEDQTFFLWDILPAFPDQQLLLSEPEDGEQYQCALYHQGDHTILPLENVPEGLPEPQGVDQRMLALFTSTGGLSLYDLESSTPGVPIGLSSIADVQEGASPWFLSPMAVDSQRPGSFAVFFCLLTEEEKALFPEEIPDDLTWHVAWMDGESGTVKQADTGLAVQGAQLGASGEESIIRLRDGILSFDYYGPITGMGDLREYQMDLDAEEPVADIKDPEYYSLDFYEDETVLEQLYGMGYTAYLLDVCERNRCILDQLLYPEVSQVIDQNANGQRLYLSDISRISSSYLALVVADNPSSGQLYGVLPMFAYGDNRESIGLIGTDRLFAVSQSGASLFRLDTPPEEYASGERSGLSIPEEEVFRFLCAFSIPSQQWLVEFYYTAPPSVIYSEEHHDDGHYYCIAIYNWEGELLHHFQTVVPLSFGGERGTVSIPQNVSFASDGCLSFTLETENGEGPLYWFLELEQEEQTGESE